MRKIIVLLLALLTVFVFSSCYSEPDTQSMVTFTVKSSDEAVNDFDSMFWKYTAVKTDDTINRAGQKNTPTLIGSDGKLKNAVGPLTYGDWTFVLYGARTKNEANAGKYAYIGFADATVKNAKVTVEVKVSGQTSETEYVPSGSGSVVASTKKEVSSSKATEFSMPTSPLDATGKATDKTTLVSFPAGSFTEDKDVVLTVQPYTASEASGKFTVTTEGNNAIAGIDIKLTDSDGAEIKEFNGKDISITTYIVKGLNKENITVKYSGNEEEEFAIDEYDTETGKLVFKTKHFSEYYVTADVNVVNTTTNTGYANLDAACEKAGSGNAILLINDIALEKNIVLEKKDVTLDLAGHHVYIKGQVLTKANGYIFKLGNPENTDGTSGTRLILNDSVGGAIIGGDYQNADSRGFELYDGSYLEINDGIRVQTFSRSGGAGIWIDFASEVVINDANFYVSNCAINSNALDSKLTINKGKFVSMASNQMKDIYNNQLHVYTICAFGEFNIDNAEVYGVQGALSVLNNGVIGKNTTAITTTEIFEQYPEDIRESYKELYCLATSKSDATIVFGEVFYALYVAGEDDIDAKCIVNGGYFDSPRFSALIGNSADGGAGNAAFATINGGTFNNNINADGGNPNYGKGELEIRGGIIRNTTEEHLKKYLAEGSILQQIGEGEFKVVSE